MIARCSTFALALSLVLGCKDQAPKSQAAPAPPSQPAPAAGSGSQAATPGPGSAPQPGSVDQAKSGSGARPVIHGDKWSSDEPGGRAFKAFKETWVYVDGVPKGVLQFPEIPASMTPAWRDDVEGLDFKPGDTGPREKKIQILRWRLAEYLQLVGVDVSKIKYVYIHGNGVVAIPGDTFRKNAHGITFDFTGNDLTKTRFYWPTTMKTNTAYDRYAAVSVFIEKPPLKLDRHNQPYIGDVEIGNSIPYFGTPLRGGFRVYVDYKLAMIVKRNELTNFGRTNLDKPNEDPTWSLLKLLEEKGFKVDPAAGDLVIARDLMTQKRQRLDEAYVKDLRFSSTSESSGGIMIGKDKLQGNALHLYSKGKVPEDKPLPPLERDWQPTN